MINKISFKFIDSGNDCDRYTFPILLDNLNRLGMGMNRNDFKVGNTPIFDDYLVGDEESVGDVIGQEIYVICDEMFNNLVMKEKERSYPK